MTKPSSATLHVIDTEALNRFIGRQKQRLGMPECILEEYSLNDQYEMNNKCEYPPFKQFQTAEGYEFIWGCIMERRTEQYIVWDFCFNQLLSQYLKSGKRLNELQRAVFYALERSVECTTRDIVPVLSMEEGWKIIPCSAVGAFTLVIHFSQETQARVWAVDNLLHEVLPSIITSLQQDVSQELRS